MNMTKVLLIPLILISSGIYADTITYSGNNYSSIPLTTGSVSYTTDMSLNGSIIFTGSLPGNVTNYSIEPESFTFNDGLNTLTESTQNISYHFAFNTDSTGEIIGWDIVIEELVLHDTTDGFTRAIMQLESNLPDQTDLVATLGCVSDSEPGCDRDTIISVATSNIPGSFTVVPLPASFLLLASGLLGFFTYTSSNSRSYR